MLNNRKKNTKKLRYLFLSLILILLLFTPFQESVYTFFESFFAKQFQQAHINAKNEKTFLQSLFRGKELLKENTKLREEIARLKQKNFNLMRHEKWSRMDEIFQKELAQTHFIPSFVLKKNENQSFIIQGGKNQNIQVGDLVLASDLSLVGEVKEVFKKTALVRLFSQKDAFIDAILFPEELSVRLQGNGEALYGELSRDVEVSLGDPLYAQEKPQFLLGVVSAIDFDPRDPVKRIYVSPLISPSSIQALAILKKQ